MAQMTPLERRHSEQFDSFRTGTRILDRLETVKKFAHPSDTSVRVTIDSLVANHTCANPSVFVGRVESQRSHPISDGTFLFTDYVVRVEQLVRNRGARPSLSPGRTIVVARPGGAIDIGGVTVTATHDMYPPLRTGGLYLFFAEPILGLDTFKSGTRSLTLEIDAESVRRVVDPPARARAGEPRIDQVISSVARAESLCQ
jgi:hypothetical protein